MHASERSLKWSSSISSYWQDICNTGGKEAHGVAILEVAVLRYLQHHERCPVVVFDHVDPKACNLADPRSPLLQLGRRYNQDAPSLRPVLVLDDYGLEALQQGAFCFLDDLLLKFKTQAIQHDITQISRVARELINYFRAMLQLLKNAALPEIYICTVK